MSDYKSSSSDHGSAASIVPLERTLQFAKDKQPGTEGGGRGRDLELSPHSAKDGPVVKDQEKLPIEAPASVLRTPVIAQSSRDEILPPVRKTLTFAKDRYTNHSRDFGR